MVRNVHNYLTPSVQDTEGKEGRTTSRKTKRQFLSQKLTGNIILINHTSRNIIIESFYTFKCKLWLKLKYCKTENKNS